MSDPDMLMAREKVVARVQDAHVGNRGHLVGIPRNLGCHYHASGVVWVGRLSLPKGVIFYSALAIQGKDIVTCQHQMGMGR